MAYFAQIDEDGTVLDVISISNDDAPDPAPSNSEPLGQAFIAALAVNDPRLEGTWIQTSYSGRIRKQYAGKGYRYDAEADVFIAPQPFPSWIFDANHDWQPPTPYPSDGHSYVWDEATLSWVSVSALHE
jgi:hypothetical protein